MKFFLLKSNLFAILPLFATEQAKA